MKKIFLFALAAAFAFTSCTKDETLATAQPGAIDFAVAANNATRSNYDPSITTANIKEFAVYGWMSGKKADGTQIGGDVFNYERVTRDNGSWTYGNTQYWTRNVYYLSALSPAPEDTTARNWRIVQTGHNTLGLGTIMFDNNQDAEGKQQDLVYWAAKIDNTNGDAENAKVPVVFNHLLSKVKFTFKNGFSNELTTIRVTDVKITNAESQGTINLNTADWWEVEKNNCWAFAGDQQTLEFGDVVDAAGNGIIEITDSKESDKEVLLFPAYDKTYNIEFTVEVLNGEVIAAKHTHEVELTHTFQMGYCYNLSATLDAENATEEELKPIEFEVTVKDWMQEGTGEVEVPVTEDHENVTIEAGATMNLGCNGTIKGSMTVAGTLDGNGHTLFAEATPANNGMIRPTGTATVKNVNINGKGVRTTDDKSIRGIYITTNGTYVIENVKILNCGYAFNAQTSAQSSLEVSKSTFEGWSSYDLDGNLNVTDVLAEFKDVNFTRGAYEKLVDDQGNLLKNGWFRPYNSTILTNCTFEEGYTIDLGKLVAGGTVKFVNCTYGTTVITADNIATLGFVENYDANKVAF